MRPREEILDEVRSATDCQTLALVEVLVDIRDILAELAGVNQEIAWLRDDVRGLGVGSIT